LPSQKGGGRGRQQRCARPKHRAPALILSLAGEEITLSAKHKKLCSGEALLVVDTTRLHRLVKENLPINNLSSGEILLYFRKKKFLQEGGDRVRRQRGERLERLQQCEHTTFECENEAEVVALGKDFSRIRFSTALVRKVGPFRRTFRGEEKQRALSFFHSRPDSSSLFTKRPQPTRRMRDLRSRRRAPPSAERRPVVCYHKYRQPRAHAFVLPSRASGLGKALSQCALCNTF